MLSTADLYTDYRNKMQRIADIKFANALLQWDQEIYLPPKGAAFRGRQISTLSELAHQLFSEDGLGNTLQELLSRQDLTVEEKRNVELTWEDYSKNKKYSSAFVRKLSEQTNKAFHSWIEARRQNAFSVFEQDLEALVQLKREEADILGYNDHPYNALLHEFEKGATVSLLDNTYKSLLPSLKGLLDAIKLKPQVNNSFLHQHFPRQQQWDWGMYLIRELNFDFEAGRQDISEHPFSVSFCNQDVRITTRIDEADFGNMTWSCIHETGHALYEQGLPEMQYGLPLGEACSYSIHESQSRLWENNVGRSKGFWKHYFPKLQQYFPQQLEQVSLEDFYSGINQVQPSFIRTEADEITYHFHVYIRYELEKKLIEGGISVRDIPAFWNEQYLKQMGVIVPNDLKGCLQDVHWSHGSFGYFPTYSLGSFYAAQFYATAAQQLKNIETNLAMGNSAPLLAWLRSEIHANGRQFTSEELCKKLTGETLNVEHFVNYLYDKYQSIYNL